MEIVTNALSAEPLGGGLVLDDHDSVPSPFDEVNEPHERRETVGHFDAKGLLHAEDVPGLHLPQEDSQEPLGKLGEVPGGLLGLVIDRLILGAPGGREGLEELGKVLGTDTTMGNVLLEARKRLLKDEMIMGLLLVGQGDADWRVPKR